MSVLNLIPLFVVIPLGAAFLTSLVGKFIRRSSDVIAFIASLAMIIIAIYSRLAINSAAGKVLVYKIGGWVPPFGICMVLDGLSSFMLVTVNLIAFFVVVYSINYMEKYTDKTKFYSLFSLMVCGMNGLVVTGDLFNLFVFLEIASIASYSLVAFGTDSEELEASFKYAIMGSVASSFIFIGIAFLYSFTSTLNMADIARVLSYKQNNWVVAFVSVLFFMGFGLKAALVPFHAWLPDAHPSAPASISAMLSGVLIKALGIYSLLRIFFNIMGSSQGYLAIMMFLGGVSMISAVILALSQWDFKRLLAYHSISQIGYVVLGVGLGTPLGIFGGLYHLFNHSIFKSLLFLNSGAIDYASGTRDLKETGGFSKLMPVTARTNLIASMAIAGIPPFNGFFSKLIIIIACLQKGFLGYAILAVAASILTLASFMKVQKFIFLGDIKPSMESVKEVPLAMRISMVCLAFICVFGGLMLLPSLRFFINDAVNVLMRGTSYANVVFGAVQQ